ncbi:hypothetical protein Tco_1511770 [Tanacetum coccineum]
MFAVCACSHFQVTPKTSHLNAVKRIFKYLKGKPNLGLWYPRESPFDLEAYSDSYYARENLDRKSTIGGCQFLGRRLISWQCKKQTIVATSTTEAEYVASASCCGQVYLDCIKDWSMTEVVKKLILILSILKPGSPILTLVCLIYLSMNMLMIEYYGVISGLCLIHLSMKMPFILPLQQNIISWRYYDKCEVHCLTLEACSIYMLADRKYPLSKDAYQVMLKMKLLDGKLNEVCYKLLKMIEKQAGVRK